MLGQVAPQHRGELTFDAALERADVGVARATRNSVAAKLASAEHRIERQTHPRQSHQRNRPGNRTLRGACRHHGTQGHGDTGQLDEDEERRVQGEGIAGDHAAFNSSRFSSRRSSDRV